MSITMLTQRTGYISAFTNAGIIHSDHGVIMVDNGWGVNEGEFLLEELEKNNLRLVAIINTHAHVDHAGANQLLQKHTGCSIYLSEFEALILQGYDQLAPIVTSCEIYPIASGLKRYFTYTRPFAVNRLQTGPFEIDGAKLSIVELPGHTYGQIGVVSENILFCGDAIMEESVMKRNKLVFLSNAKDQRQTLTYIKNSSYDWYVASHGRHFANPVPTCEMYLNLIQSVQATMLKITETPLAFEEILGHVATGLNIHIHNMQKYSICKNAVIAMLNELVNDGQIEISFEENMRYYTKVS